VSLSVNHRKVLALPLIAVLGSNPFQLYHIHIETNVWSYPIQVAGLMLALCAPLLLGRGPRIWHFAIPCVAGVFLASFREVRTEPALLIASVVLACLWAPGTWRRRAGLVVLLLSVAFATGQIWSAYWNAKIDTAVEVVEAAGGRAHKGSWNLHHSLWHPIWFGLGDFGQDKGYQHTDQAAYRFAIPILNARYGTKYKLDGWFFKNEGKTDHVTKPETLPEYQLVLRDKILGDIRESPGWYLSILMKRSQRIFNHTTPVRLAFGSSYLKIPFTAWIALPLLGSLLALRRWEEVKLLLFYTPTSLPAFLMIADRGYLNPSAFHLVAFALVATWAFLATLRVVPGLRTKA